MAAPVVPGTGVYVSTTVEVAMGVTVAAPGAVVPVGEADGCAVGDMDGVAVGVVDGVDCGV